MSTIYNTSIVRDNLILHYDAANVKSYPGSGAIINNLAPNKTYGARIAGSNITFSSSEKAFSNTASAANNVTDGIYIEGLNYVNGSADAVSNMTVECWCKSKSGSSGSTGDQRIILSFDRSAVFRFAIGADGASISAGAEGKTSLQKKKLNM